MDAGTESVSRLVTLVSIIANRSTAQAIELFKMCESKVLVYMALEAKIKKLCPSFVPADEKTLREFLDWNPIDGLKDDKGKVLDMSDQFRLQLEKWRK